MTLGLQIRSLAVEKALLVSEIELLDVEITSLVPERNSTYFFYPLKKKPELVRLLFFQYLFNCHHFWLFLHLNLPKLLQ